MGVVTFPPWWLPAGIHVTVCCQIKKSWKHSWTAELRPLPITATQFPTPTPLSGWPTRHSTAAALTTYLSVHWRRNTGECSQSQLHEGPSQNTGALRMLCVGCISEVFFFFFQRARTHSSVWPTLLTAPHVLSIESPFRFKRLGSCPCCWRSVAR